MSVLDSLGSAFLLEGAGSRCVRIAAISNVASPNGGDIVGS